jgi:hypothetical protein
MLQLVIAGVYIELYKLADTETGYSEFIDTCIPGSSKRPLLIIVIKIMHFSQKSLLIPFPKLAKLRL